MSRSRVAFSWAICFQIDLPGWPTHRHQLSQHPKALNDEGFVYCDFRHQQRHREGAVGKERGLLQHGGVGQELYAGRVRRSKRCRNGSP